MKFHSLAIALTVILMCFAEAHGQSDRTFVATTGVNSDTCGTSTSPCRSFTTALGKTNPRGEIIALDSGLYDGLPVSVSTSITLTAANGVHAELPGIAVNATTSDTVILRNLYLSSNSNTTNTEGIKVNSVGAIHIENCIVNGFPAGISFTLNAAAEAFINDTVVRNSNGNGMSFSTNAGLLKAAVNHCRIENNGHSGPIADGLSVQKRGRVTVRDTVSTGNNGAGFVVTGGELTLENCEATDNGDGVIAASSETQNGNVLVSNSTVTNNSRNGFLQTGTGAFNSLGNNLVRRNGTNTSGTINVVSGT